MSINNVEKINKEDEEMFRDLSSEFKSLVDSGDLLVQPLDTDFKDRYISSLEKLVEEKERAIELIECNYNNIIERIEKEKMTLETKYLELKNQNRNKVIVNKSNVTMSKEEFNTLVNEIVKIDTKEDVDLNKIQEIVNSLMNRNNL